VAELLPGLREAGAAKQAALLLARDPAAHVPSPALIPSQNRTRATLDAGGRPRNTTTTTTSHIRKPLQRPIESAAAESALIQMQRCVTAGVAYDRESDS
jgi:hypothetical protein